MANIICKNSMPESARLIGELVANFIVGPHPGGWRASASVARRIGALPALAGAQSSVRGWLTAGKAF